MKRICIFTGTRAEYGLLRPLMQAVDEHANMQLQLLVTGSHLSRAHGHTVDQIKADGFTIHEQAPIPLADDSPQGICQAMGIGLAAYGAALTRLKPDMLVILGDRYEALATAAAATVCRVPVAHLHGGELTFGAMDESFRHAITKMAHLHFTSTEAYRQRVIQLGEQPEHVHNVGAIGVEAIQTLELLSREELEQKLGMPLDAPLILGTFHPPTLTPGQAETQAHAFLNALSTFPDTKIVLTKAGADTESQAVNRLIDTYAATHPNQVRAFTSLGQLRYLSAMKLAAVVAGNSSSGIIEAPSFGVPTVNIGDRQAGRIRATSVIDCPPEQEAITQALHTALSHDFAAKARHTISPYDQPGTIQQIVQYLATSPSGIKKIFYDLKGEERHNV